MKTQKGSGWFNSLLKPKTQKNNTANNQKPIMSIKSKSKLEQSIRDTLTDFFTIISDKRFIANDYDWFYIATSSVIRLGMKTHTNTIIKQHLMKKNNKIPTQLIEDMVKYAVNNMDPTDIKKKISDYNRYKNKQVEKYGLYYTKKALPKMTYKLSRF